MAGPVKAFNWAQGTSAAVVGPARSRVRQIVIYAAAAGSFTIKDGSASGETLITQEISNRYSFCKYTRQWFTCHEWSVCKCFYWFEQRTNNIFIVGGYLGFKVKRKDAC